MGFQATHTIKPGSGYWDTTTFPLGGQFARVPRDSTGLPVMVNGEPVQTKLGYLVPFKTELGRTLYANESSFSPLD